MARRGLPTLEEALEEAGLLPGMMEYCTKKGMKKGMEQGMEKGLEVAARNALAQGASIEFVNKITGLDIETIHQLALNN